MFGDLQTAIEWWKKSTKGVVDKKQLYSERLIVIRFEHLNEDTKYVMTEFCSKICIDYSETLLTPTYKGTPIKANSSFRSDSRHGIVRDALKRSDVHTIKERTYIEFQCQTPYSEALTLADI